MEEHVILSERLEDQLKAVEWAKAEQEKLLKEKGEQIGRASCRERVSSPV